MPAITGARRRSAVTASGVLGLVVAAGVLAGCGVQIPADPDGTENRVRGGILSVGVTHNPPWTDLDGSGPPTGSEIDLVERFANELDADVSWTEGSEASLVTALEAGEVDLVVGGFLSDTPWSEHAAVTRSYEQTRSADGRRLDHVMLTPMGENRFLSSLEEFLDRQAP